MKKKIFGLVLVVCILASTFVALPLTANAETNGIYTYTIENGEVTITDCDEEASGDIEIPATLEGYPVTAIGNYAFSNCYNLKSITIPDSVTTIGESAFSHCDNLKSITISDSVITIKDYAFSGCENLTSISIPDSVTAIGSDAFSDCTSLTSISIPDSVTYIGDWAFSCCDSLTDVYYGGTEEEWNAIEIGSENSYLTNATIHFTEPETDPLLRRELASLISNTFDLVSEVEIGESPFTDIDESDANFEEILACKKAEIMNGYENGTFSPDDSMMNCELAAYLYRTLSYIEYPMEVPEDSEYDKTKWYGEMAWIMETLGVVENITDWEAVATADSIGEVFYLIGEEYCANKNAEISLGDVDGDGIIEVKDIIALRQYVTGGYNIEVIESALDVTKDDEVNVKDVIFLRQYLAGGYGVEL